MKQIPILFSTDMVQAILEGRKTQTRRVIKYPKILNDCLDFDEGTVWQQLTLNRMQSGYKEGTRPIFEINEDADTAFSLKCPYGQPGDVLWVRETFGYSPGFYQNDAPWEHIYKADGVQVCGLGRWYPSIHMPKAASRIWLEITNVRVERLREITPDDAISEGIKHSEFLSTQRAYKDYMADASGYGDSEVDFPTTSSPLDSFFSLWQSINGSESWEANPWVWVIEFKRIEKPKA